MNITAIVLLVLLGFFSNTAGQASINFRGSSQNAKGLLVLTNAVGLISFIVFTVWGFFIYPWWVPVIGFIISLLMIPFVVSLPQDKKIWGGIFSIVAIPVLVITLLFVYL